MRLGLGLSITGQLRSSGFSLASLFAGGEEGVWYEPSDLSTLFQDTAGTTPVTAAGQSVARINDKSGNGYHATQATTAARPTYGIVPETGRRNLLEFTEQFDNAAWGKTRVTITANATTAPDGTLTADKLVENTASGVHNLSTFINVTIGVPYALTVYAKAADRSFFRLQSFNATGDAENAVFDLTTGSIVSQSGTSASTITSVGDGWYRCSVIVVNDTDNGSSISMTLFSNGVTSSYTGDGTSGIFVWGAQLEVGSTATAYQRVGTQYDVTEAGVASLHYLDDDGVDDSLPATVPDLGTDATLAYATDAGTTILTGQTIGAGSFEALRGSQTYAVLAIDRALSAAETSNLTAYLNAKRGA